MLFNVNKFNHLFLKAKINKPKAHEINDDT